MLVTIHKNFENTQKLQNEQFVILFCDKKLKIKHREIKTDKNNFYLNICNKKQTKKMCMILNDLCIHHSNTIINYTLF